MRKKILAVVLGLAGLLVLAAPAGASTATITGSLTRNQTTYYTTPRTVTVSGSNIYFRKTDGPEIDLKWYKCSNQSISGSFVNFPNPDPTARKVIGTNFAVNTVFCLAAFDYGSNSTDTFTGSLDWNVNS